MEVDHPYSDSKDSEDTSGNSFYFHGRYQIPMLTFEVCMEHWYSIKDQLKNCKILSVEWKSLHLCWSIIFQRYKSHPSLCSNKEQFTSWISNEATPSQNPEYLRIKSR